MTVITCRNIFNIGKDMNRLATVLIGMMLAASYPLISKGQEIHWQARAGIGTATLAGSVSNINNRMGFHVGGGADIGLSRNGVWRLQPALQFVRKGWKFNGYYGNEQIMEAKYSTRLNYLQLPLQMAARLSLGRDCFITLKAGAYVACGLNAKTGMEIVNTEHDETFDVNHFSEAFDFHQWATDKESRRVNYPKFNRWDAGLVTGIDFTLSRFIIGGSMSCGFVKVCDSFMGNPLANAMLGVLAGGNPKNLTLDLSVGYQF